MYHTFLPLRSIVIFKKGWINATKLTLSEEKLVNCTIWELLEKMQVAVFALISKASITQYYYGLASERVRGSLSQHTPSSIIMLFI